MSAKVYRKIPTSNVIKIPLPDVRQHTNFSCGAAALHAICAYYGVGPDKEEDFIKELGTDPEDGTHPSEIVKGAKKYGLKVIIKEDMTINDVKHYLDLGRPIILNIQAWGSEKDYKKNKSGHYLNAIGYDERGFYLQDPSISGRRGFISFSELERRWHDKDKENNKTNRLGIVIWRNTKPAYSTKAIHVR